MAGEQLDLPYGLGFTCRSCGDCCRTRTILLTRHEKEKIEALGVASASSKLAGRALFVPLSDGKQSTAPLFRLARTDGACVFLEKDNSCLIQTLYGREAKPLACRRFPFLFVQGPDGTTVSASFACPAVGDGSGTPLRQQEMEIRPLLSELLPQQEDGRESSLQRLFSVSDRIVLSAQIGLDWSSYRAMERATIEILEDESHSLAVRLLATLTLVSAAIAEYGRGARTTPPFARWMEHMNSGHGQRWLYQEAVSQRSTSARNRRLVLAPLISAMEAGCAVELGIEHRGDGLLGTMTLARGRGRSHLPSLAAQVELETVDRVSFDQDSPGLKALLVLYLGECLRRKVLLRHSNLLKGTQHLLVRFALVRWYAVALASCRGRSAATVEDLREAIQVIERYYDLGDTLSRVPALRLPSARLMGLLLDLVAAPVDLVSGLPARDAIG